MSGSPTAVCVTVDPKTMMLSQSDFFDSLRKRILRQSPSLSRCAPGPCEPLPLQTLKTTKKRSHTTPYGPRRGPTARAGDSGHVRFQASEMPVSTVCEVRYDNGVCNTIPRRGDCQFFCYLFRV